MFCLAANAADAGNPVLLNPAGQAPVIVREEQATMKLAAGLLARDLRALGGADARQTASLDDCRKVCVVLGRHDSPLVQEVLRQEGLTLPALEWEAYERIVIGSRRHPDRRIVLIAGADTRGTVYGVVDLTRELGVSAWEWWADVTPARRERIEIAAGRIHSSSPHVQYRGIFLNDEDWGLQPWAAKHDPSGDIGPATYARIFELMWRLKANIIWPAMHDSTKPFYQVAGNAETARDYAIVVGTSHAEPMMRNNVREWDGKERGAFNFFSNRKALVSYWDQRVNEVKAFENMYSVGIRGVHDSAMEGARNVDEARQGVSEAIAVQRGLLEKALGKPARQVPQVLTLYKEVLDIYKAGLQVADDITLIWPDDNYGYLHQLSTPQEALRPGGTGIYYHISYWGRPHDYLWLGTTHPALIREQLGRAVSTGSRKVWIVNVGDIKPAEYLTQYFLDLAFDRKLLERAPAAHLAGWMRQQFGAQHAAEIAAVMNEYYDLAWERRPEFMGFSQTEPTTPVRPTDYLQSGGAEAEARLARYEALLRRADALAGKLAPALADAYFQLVLYPVRSSANLNIRVLRLDLALLHARQARPDAGEQSARARAAQAAIAADTARYNALGGGKWDGMMDAAPRRLPVFAVPYFPVFPDVPAQRECSETVPVGDRIVTVAAAQAASSPGWTPVPGLGSFGASMRSNLSLSAENLLRYEFATSAQGRAVLKLVAVPVHPLTSNDKLRIAVSLDGAAFEELDFATHGRSEEWKANVLSNTAVRKLVRENVGSGRHELRVRALDPGFILDRFELSFDGAPAFYGRPPELSTVSVENSVNKDSACALRP